MGLYTLRNIKHKDPSFKSDEEMVKQHVQLEESLEQFGCGNYQHAFTSFLILDSKHHLPYPKTYFPLGTNQRRLVTHLTQPKMHSFNGSRGSCQTVPGVQELTAITSHLPGKFEFVYAPKVQVQVGGIFVGVGGTSFLDFLLDLLVLVFGCFSNVSSRNPLIDFCKNGFGRTLFG